MAFLDSTRTALLRYVVAGCLILAVMVPLPELERTLESVVKEEQVDEACCFGLCRALSVVNVEP